MPTTRSCRQAHGRRVSLSAWPAMQRPHIVHVVLLHAFVDAQGRLWVVETLMQRVGDDGGPQYCRQLKVRYDVGLQNMIM